MSSRLITAGRAAVVVLLVGGCGTDSAAADPSLSVYAAASLRAPFETIAEEYENAHPGLTVQLNFAGSADLAAQIIAGAPAEVFAAADPVTMERVAAEGLLASEPEAFATNILTIAVAPGNPLGIDSLEALDDPDVSVVLCAPQVPCGAAAKKLQRAAGITIEAVSEEGSVTDVLGKVTSGQADAGLVYTTDSRSAAEAVDSIPIDGAAGAANTYPIAVTGSGGEPAGGFVDFVTGPRGREILTAGGFGMPDR